MSKPLEVGDILYYKPCDEHLLLIEPSEYEDDDGYTKETWTVLILETGQYTWCWEFILEDTVDFARAA